MIIIIIINVIFYLWLFFNINNIVFKFINYYINNFNYNKNNNNTNSNIYNKKFQDQQVYKGKSTSRDDVL